MQIIGSLWWVWLAGMLVCWGYVAYHRLRHSTSMDPSGQDKSSAQPVGAGRNVLVGARYLGFVFLVLLVFSVVVKLFA
jgi:hypothetical protein